MSELTNSRSGFVRSGLLASVSAFALLGAVYTSQGALAESGSGDRPAVWIELGGQLERTDSTQELFSPPFFDKATPAVLAPMVDAQLMPRYSIGGEGKVMFAPNGSDWVFSASVRYGRSNANRHLHYESKHPVVPIILGGYVVTSAASTKDEFGDAQSSLRESHTIVDFKAGKDVGLGLFGGKSTSIFSAGIRFAQFVSSSDVSLHARPVYHSLPPFQFSAFYLHSNYHQSNKAIVQSRRSTRLIGPEVSWDASTPVVGNESSMAVTLDWGVNAAVLFGRQKAQVHHQTSGSYFKGVLSQAKYSTSYVNPAVDRNRSRSVIVPDLGGFVGASLKFQNAKVSLGYRADFFFGAMDGGLDKTMKENVGFYGPFASVSIGLGG